MKKLLGKYIIIEEKSEDIFVAESADKIFEITRKAKDKDDDLNSIFSHKAQNLSSLHHENIINLKIDEDEEYFYFIKEIFDEGHEKLDSSIFASYPDKNKRYQKIIECYLQILSAISHIHKEGFYHGNINPSNILVDRDNRVYLLDFGKSYFYEIGTEDETFYSPEQLGDIKEDISTKSDIFSFGLCMLKILLDSFEPNLFEAKYQSPKDLDSIFKYITDEWELEDIENSLFLLMKQMLIKEPSKRIELDKLKEELDKLLSKVRRVYHFELNLSKDVYEKYKKSNDCYDKDDVLNDIKNKTQNHIPYWHFGKDQNGREEIKICCGNLVFCCSTKNQKYLFCFLILDSEKIINEVCDKGVSLYNDFEFTIGKNNWRISRCDDVRRRIDELKEHFKENNKRLEKLEIDKQAIKTEEQLLAAMRKTLEQKKQIRRVAKFKKDDKANDKFIFILQEEQKQDNEEQEQENKQEDSKNKKTKKQEKDFKSGQDVVITQKNETESIKGEVDKYNPATKELSIKLKEKYETLNYNLDKKLTYIISYDYEIEEIILKKQERALEALKSANVAIPNLLRKINEPRELSENELVDIDMIDKNLDENQQEATRKALSLDGGCEIMILQGPPGTGKTTTITEMVKQFQKRHKHYKILVSSQSNQAVDNVLEKICEQEDKILRIGNDKNKMSEKAREFVLAKVLNKLIKENRERIRKNPICDEDENVQKKLRKMQNDFDKSLQKITSKMAQDSKDSKKSNKHRDLANLFAKNIRIIFGTLIGISSWRDFREITFDVAIVDEAGRATLSEILVPCIKAKKIILIGDHKQLAPVIDDEIVPNLDRDTTKKDVATSFFERFFDRLEMTSKEKARLENFKHTLTYNYRAHKDICEIYSQAFYEGKLQTKEEISEQRKHNLSSCFKSSVVWLDTHKKLDRADEQKDTGKRNPCNADVIYHTLEVIKREKLESVQDIGIITPYKAQKDHLVSKLKSIKEEYKKDKNISIDIGTVDSFQGSDRDIIIYDCVRSKRNNYLDGQQRKGGKIDFIADEKRLNVSLSRAKKLLIIVGDMEFLAKASVSEGENPFAEIIKVIRSKDKNQYEIIELKDNKEK